MKFSIGDTVINKATGNKGIIQQTIDRKGSGGWYYQVLWSNGRVTRSAQSKLIKSL